MKFEQDEVELTGGVRHGVTLGGPVAIRVGNTEWPKWETVMPPDPVACRRAPRGQARNAPLSRPPARSRGPGRDAEVRVHRRPADPGAGQRAGDRRAGRARRGRAAAAGAGARRRICHVVSARLGGVPEDRRCPCRRPARIDEDPVRCLDTATSEAMVAEVDAARRTATPLAASSRSWPGLPPGLGSYTQWDRRLDARLAGALMSDTGDQGRGDRSRLRDGRTPGSGSRRDLPEPPKASGGTNRAGGVEGGMTTGEPLRVRAAMKPISTVPAHWPPWTC